VRSSTEVGAAQPSRAGRPTRERPRQTACASDFKAAVIEPRRTWYASVLAMNAPPKLTRIPMSMFVAAALLAACGPAGADDGETGETAETGETGDGDVDVDACIDPGTELLPNVKPAVLPTQQSSVTYTCTAGWGTDAPRLAPEWTVQVGELSTNFNFVPPSSVAHPDGGVIVVGLGQFAHFGTDGEPLWTNDVIVDGQLNVAIEQAGTILLSVYNWNSGDTSLTRYDADGALVGEINIPWNGPQASIWGVTTYGSDIVIGANDEDAQGFYETTLIRLDPDGNVVLRKSTNQAGGIALAVTDSGVALFGSFPGFLVSIDSGEVLGMLVPTGGNIVNARSQGDEFIVASNVFNTTGDLGVGRYSSLGAEQWLQSYDRATLNDNARALAVGADGGIVVAGGTSLLDFTNSWWFSTQPVVFGLDADGNPLWTDRMAAHADPSSVAIGVDADVYVAGLADAGTGNQDQPPTMAWLRRYVP
jgi:hypothetical protein